MSQNITIWKNMIYKKVRSETFVITRNPFMSLCLGDQQWREP